MKNQKVSTSLGTIILVIFSITAGVIVWQVMKNQEATYEATQIITSNQNNLQSNSNTPPLSNLSSTASLIEKAISSDISTWKEYKNNEFGFSVSYPEELKLASTGSAGQIFGKLIHTNNSTGNIEALVTIYEPATKNISNKPFAKMLSDYKKDYFVNDQRKVVITKQEEKNINGIEMLKQVYSAGDDKEKSKTVRIQLNQSDFDENNIDKMSFGYEHNAIRYIIPNKKGMFIIINTWKSDDNYENLLDKIMSTFHNGTN
jgi:hypothetical protein